MSTADKLNALVQTKADIKQALIDKGQNPTDVFSTYADDIRAIETGGGSGGVFDFASLGYTGDEEPLKSGLAYAKEINDKYYTDQRIPHYMNDTKLIIFPSIPIPSDLSSYFSGCTSLYLIPRLKPNEGNINNMLSTFKNCTTLNVVPQLEYSYVTEMANVFENCINLTDVGTIDCSSSVSTSNMFCNCFKISYNPCINTDNVTDMTYMFMNCNILNNPDFSKFNTGNVTKMTQMFSCDLGYNSVMYNLDISNFDTSKVTDMFKMFYGLKNLKTLVLPNNFGSVCVKMQSMFDNCSKLERLGVIDSALVTNMDNMFNGCINLIRIESISVKSLSTMDYDSVIGFAELPNLRYFLCKDIGTKSSVTSVKFTYYNLSKWGENNEENPDARQSLIDSLITYSFDRASAGYSTCNITLHNNNKALLTEEEIAQITAKGFTIV